MCASTVVNVHRLTIIQFAHDDKTVFFTAGDLARIKIFSLPVPPTPSTSTVDPSFSEEYRTPRELTSTGAVSAIQPLSGGRLVFTRSSLTSPNEVFVLRGLDETGKPTADKLTKLAEAGLNGKSLDSGSDFWFEGAEGKKIQGWTIKPPGFKSGEKKKWPILLAIHGGPEGAWEDQWSNRWNLNSESSPRNKVQVVQLTMCYRVKYLLSKGISLLPSTLLVPPHSAKVSMRSSYASASTQRSTQS